MNNNYFLNTYGYLPTIGFDTRETQALNAGVTTELCHMYGYGYYDCANPPTGRTPKCLTFTARESDSWLKMIMWKNDEVEPYLSFEYSLDDGNKWEKYTFGDFEEGEALGKEITLTNVGDTVQFRGVNPSMGDDTGIYFIMYGEIAASGDVTSLTNGIGGDAILSHSCYSDMFSNCAVLTTAPELPSMTLAEGCYYSMFANCSALTTAPELPATTLVTVCYNSMFAGCSNLNYIKALFTTEPNDNYTADWVVGVSPTGTFVKSGDATWNVTGLNGVPSGWTVEGGSDDGGKRGNQ